MARSWMVWLSLASIVVLSVAESIVPTNWTAADAADRNNETVSMRIFVADESTGGLVPVLALTPNARMDLPSSGLMGPVMLSDPNNVLAIQSSQVAFISCDEYPGEIQATQVFDQAWQAKATAIVLYSRYSDWCNLSDYTASYSWVYTMKNRTDTLMVLGTYETSGSHMVYATIAPSTIRSSDGNGSTSVGPHEPGSSDGGRHIPPGTPSTAVAMIILYSITGIITALFLVIIVTGAMRAHRHPERYGPRQIVGRPRQSRARGLARAIVDTLPIVKFGEQREEPKPTDVELAESAQERAEPTDRNVPSTEQARDVPTQQVANTRQSIEEGIAAAISAQQPSDQPANRDHLGCSICTEDFQTGEDQRVLPCDHKFHPACIDPWLLNVSGTCPLCRIDLRPQTSNTDETGEVDENGNPVLREPNFELNSAPLDAEQAAPQRMGIRRSLMEGIRGVGGRPPAMTPEERAQALYQWRMATLAARRRMEAMPRPTEEETSTRQRLRRAFGIRTRRTGQGEVQDEGDEASPAPAPEGSPNARS